MSVMVTSTQNSDAIYKLKLRRQVFNVKIPDIEYQSYSNYWYGQVLESFIIDF